MTEDVLVLQSLHKSFGAFIATRDVSLSLKRGEIHALIGPNGAGKSTLIGQITGWLTPDAGRVSLNGEDLTALPVHQRARKGLGRSFQISCLADGFSAKRNVMLSVQAKLESSFRFWRAVDTDPRLIEAAEQALERVGLLARAEEKVSALSHGERRQLEMACALALEPQCFLLDEPMAGMGPEGSQQLTELLEKLKAQAPILLIEHDMDAVFRLADRISVLVAGEIILTGSAAEISRSPEVRRAYLGEDDDA